MAQWIAFAFASFLPMSVYMNPLITNEVTAAMLIAGAVYVFLRWGMETTPSYRQAAWLGLVATAGLMAKYGGLWAVFVGALALMLGTLKDTGRRPWLVLGIYVLVIASLSGWYYARNIELFSDPFIGNWDTASGFHYEQKPSFRTIEFYSRFGAVFFQHPEAAPWTSWLDGNFGSMWADVHGNFFDEQNKRAFLFQSITIILAALPSAGIVVGLIMTLLSVIRQPTGNPDLILFSFPWLTWVSLVSFTMEVPTYSTVKAFFFLSIVPCMGIFLLRGREVFIRQARPIGWMLDLTVWVICALTIVLYRYDGQ